MSSHTTTFTVTVPTGVSAITNNATGGQLAGIIVSIGSAGNQFEGSLATLAGSDSASSLGQMTSDAVQAQMNQAVFELVSGAGKSLTDAMKGVSRKLG